MEEEYPPTAKPGGSMLAYAGVDDGGRLVLLPPIFVLTLALDVEVGGRATAGLCAGAEGLW